MNEQRYNINCKTEHEEHEKRKKTRREKKHTI